MSERNYEKANEFHERFKKLVRDYFKEYPETEEDRELLAMIQDKTSCFSPYIWSDEK